MMYTKQNEDKLYIKKSYISENKMMNKNYVPSYNMN